ncbi:MAG: hypothetical protein MUC92_03010 [Fimbriimonadaceae bacterium]|jgi:predicted small lipoprotein YifL|nr:hypothetical protein [Fimbriimonadaceae bacterium]
MKKTLLLLAAATLAAAFLTGCNAGDEGPGELPPPVENKVDMNDPNIPEQAKSRMQNAQKIAESNAKTAAQTK